MLRKRGYRDLRRRVAVCQVLFSLAALAVLTAGFWYWAPAAVRRALEADTLHLIELASREIEPLSSQQADKLQAAVLGLQDRWGLAYCAVVSDAGRYLAHTSGAQIGCRRQVPAGEVTRRAGVPLTRYHDPQGRPVCEYQAEIDLADGAEGLLLVAVVEPALRGAFLRAAVWLPLLLAAPVLIVLAGAGAVCHSLRSVAAIERQLRQLAGKSSFDPAQLKPAGAGGAAARGWDQLLAFVQRDQAPKGIQQRLRQALEGYRHQKAELILNTLPDGIAVTDEQGVITFANKALSGLLGLGAGPEELRGKRIQQCLELEAAGPAAAPLLDPAVRNRPVVGEIRRAGGQSEGTLRVARLPLQNPSGGGSPGQVWSIRDVTQQKLADQMRDQFVNAASHELRTPLANIKAYAETLALSEVIDVEQQKEFCNTIDAEVTRLARFVDDLLHLSRMEVGSTALCRQVTDMGRLLREAVDKIAGQIRQKQLQFDVELPAKLPELLVDKDKLIVALVNLLGNAAKYTPEGGRVCLRVEANARQNALLIEVEDTGIGIAAEELPRIFDKFYRSSDPRVHRQTGSGLGLSLTQEIIRLHGGKLSVQSELDKGSKFTVILPMVMEEAPCTSA